MKKYLKIWIIILMAMALSALSVTGDSLADTGPAATPTATRTSGGRHTIVYQQGAHPDRSYAGAADVILANDARPSANLGGMEQLETFYGDPGIERRRSLLRWNLTDLPPNAHIVSATIALYRFDGDAEAEMPLALYRVTQPWTEGTGWQLHPAPGYMPDGATWNMAAPGIPWRTPGGDIDQITDYGHGANGIISQVTVPADMTKGWLRWDATEALRAWIEDKLPNDGLMLRGTGGRYTYHTFRSKEAEAVARRPKLTVTYAFWRTPTPLHLPLLLRG